MQWIYRKVRQEESKAQGQEKAIMSGSYANPV